MNKEKSKKKKTNVPKPRKPLDHPKNRKAKKNPFSKPDIPFSKQITLFSHLPQKEKKLQPHEGGFGAKTSLHPMFLQIGLKMGEGVLVGGNARTLALLKAFKQFVLDFKFRRREVEAFDLNAAMKEQINFIVDSRPLCTGQANAIIWMKKRISRLSDEDDEDYIRSELSNQIDEYIQHKIIMADRVIVGYASEKIKKGDVVMIYGRSSSVISSLLYAHERIQKEIISNSERSDRKSSFLDVDQTFRVVVMDSRPRLEGRRALEELTEAGISVTYAFLPGITYVINDVTKVLLGASGIYSNGNVVSRAGTAMVALAGHQQSIPVMVCCETHKFSQRVQMDAICHNELCDPNELINTGYRKKRFLSDWRDQTNMKILNLSYDLTPAKFISMIISEVGIIPPSSVPVVISTSQDLK